MGYYDDIKGRKQATVQIHSLLMGDGGLLGLPFLQDIEVNLFITKYWIDLVGSKINVYTKCVRVQDRVLFINLSSPLAKNELMMNKTRLIKKINRLAGKVLVSDITLTNG